MKHRLFLLLLCLAPLRIRAQPVALQRVQIRAVATGLSWPVRLARDPAGALVWVTLDGRLFRKPFPLDSTPAVEMGSPATHGLTGLIQGLAIGADGSVYLVANERNDSTNVGLVRRGRPVPGGGFAWRTVMRTEPYPRSNTPYDHSFNGIALSPDGRHLYVNSGSRTDHGEVQANAGRYPGLREVPLTSALFRIPADADSLLLPSDEARLRAGGYLFADGLRNAFDLAFDHAGRLFATENAGDRDDNEELNWIREGHHYGFPWRIGTTDTPMRFPGYDPSTDRLLNPASSSVQRGDFYNDPAYPSPPAGVMFTEPIVNLGPDANLYRDPLSGAVLDADGKPFATFTTHRSPLGLVMNPNPGLRYVYDACVLSWTGQESELLAPFADEGEDLLCLTWADPSVPTSARVQRVATGFVNPVDQVVEPTGQRLYVIEFAASATLWEVTFNTLGSAEPSAEATRWKLAVSPHPLVAGKGRISFTPPVSQRVRIDVLNVLGQYVANVFEGGVIGGEPQVLPVSTSLGRGVYLLRIEGMHGMVSQRMVVN